MEENKIFSVIIADDNQDFIVGLKILLSRFKHLQIIGEANCGIDLLKHPKLFLADIAIIDINMPDLNGIDVGKQINFINPRIKLVAVSLYEEEVYLQDLITSGFRGFVSKVHVANKIGDVLNIVSDSQYAFPHQIKLKSDK
nr:response regulator transcription factor [uncultured Carboxylicivirga sp.]